MNRKLSNALLKQIRQAAEKEFRAELYRLKDAPLQFEHQLESIDRIAPPITPCVCRCHGWKRKGYNAEKRCWALVGGIHCGTDYIAIYGVDRSPNTYSDSFKLRDLR